MTYAIRSSQCSLLAIEEKEYNSNTFKGNGDKQLTKMGANSKENSQSDDLESECQTHERYYYCFVPTSVQ